MLGESILNQIPQEKWAQINIDGCECYFVSNWHRVFSLKSGKLIKPYLHKSRSSLYWRFNLNGKKVFGHVLVGDHFLLPGESDQNQYEHLDNNTLNNVAWNLARVSQSENQKLRYKKSKLPEWLNEKAARYRAAQTSKTSLPEAKR